MDEKTLRQLEFSKVLQRLAEHTSFPLGRELALGLRPSSDAQEVARRLALAAEADRLLELKPDLSLHGAQDLRASLRQARLQGTLEPLALLGVRATLLTARHLRITITRLTAHLRHLVQLAEELDDCPDLEREIAFSIGERGEVLDWASPRLAVLRREAKAAHEALLARLQELVAEPRARQLLQEPIITVRQGRYVLPLKSECKGQLPGIVHDVSASGATLFIEPLATVALNNRWRELQRAEEQEVEHILRRLSQLVGQQAEALEKDIATLAQIDLALAAARYGRTLAGRVPSIQPLDDSARPHLRLVNARHPLLAGQVVPLSLEIGVEYHGLVITGPNTGGKTVALKTVGLLTLMALAGLPIPAEAESRIPVFHGLYADIGDEQSIEQSLSTFGSHMGTIVQILARADQGSLVLLDELGAGTEPAEGSALARAILAELVRRHTLTLATTHHRDLKVFAHGTPGLKNASMEFDAETLAPTYRLILGLPGRSNALAVAARLGLPEPILAEARQLLPEPETHLEGLLEAIQQEHAAAHAQRRALEEERSQVSRLRADLQGRLQEIEGEKEQAVEAERRRVLEELTEVEERLRRLAATIAEAAPQGERLAAAKGELRALRRTLGRRRWRRLEEVAPLALPPWGRGDPVHIRGLNQVGELLAPPNDEGEAEVLVGAFKVRVPAGQLERPPQPPMRAAPSEPLVRLHRPSSPSPPSPVLDLRGRRPGAIGEELDRYLNDAFLAGLATVRLIHGKGAGVLRQAVHTQLAQHPLIKSFTPAEAGAGGEGATLVELAAQPPEGARRSTLSQGGASP